LGNNPEERRLVLRRAWRNGDKEGIDMKASQKKQMTDNKCPPADDRHTERLLIEQSPADAPERDLDGEEIVVGARRVVEEEET